MVNPQLRAVWCTVSCYKINFNGRRAVVTFAKDYIRLHYYSFGCPCDNDQMVLAEVSRSTFLNNNHVEIFILYNTMWFK